MPPRPRRTSPDSAAGLADRDVLAFIAVCPSRPSWLTSEYCVSLGFNTHVFDKKLHGSAAAWHIEATFDFYDYNDDDDSYTPPEYQNLKGFTIAAEVLRPDDLDKPTQALSQLWEHRFVCRDPHKNTVHVQARVMREAIAFVQDKKEADFSDVDPHDPVWKDWAYTTSELLTDLFGDPRWVEFARKLPRPVADVRWEKAQRELEKFGADLSSPGLREYLTQNADASERESRREHFVFWQDFMRQGHPEHILAQLRPETRLHAAVSAIAAMSDNRPSSQAVEILTAALKREGTKRTFGHWFFDWIYAVALYRDRARPETRKKLEQLAGLKKISQDCRCSGFWLVAAAGCLIEPTDKEIQARLSSIQDKAHYHPLRHPFSAVSRHLLLCKTAAHHFFHFHFSDSDLNKSEEKFLAYNRILALDVYQELEDLSTLLELKKITGLNPLLPVFVEQPEWEKVLDRLSASQLLEKKTKAEKKSAAQTRLVYALSTSPFELSVRLQKRTASGWSKGTKVTLSALQAGVEGMNEQDRRIADCLEHPYGYASRWVFNAPKAMLALAGCPNVVDARTDESVRVEKIPLQIAVKGSDMSGWVFDSNLAPNFSPLYDWVSFYEAEPGRVVVIETSAEQRHLLRETTNLQFPPESKGKLTDYLESLSVNTPVVSSLVKGVRSKAKKSGEARITLRLQPLSADSFAVSAFVRPLTELQLTCEPGKGLPSIAAGSLQVERNLAAEAKHWTVLTEALANFAQNRDSDRTWQLTTLECLNFLEVLHEQSEHCVLEWPEGEKLKVVKSALTSANLNLSVMSVGMWLAVEGSVRISPRKALTMAELLEKLEQSQGHFIRLSENEYVALTESFKKQLEQLDNFSSRDRRGNVRLSRFNAPVIDALEQGGMRVQADEGFRAIVDRIRDSEQRRASVPAGLRAELRPYQIEGYEWMTRLAGWGAGALLADDMGLGKTLQTIALLLSRAAEGPALVVMPSAVLYNWANELSRFAPALTVKILNTADRAETIEKAGVGDVILTTYGIMASEIDLLSPRQWSTLVLDEAHTLKNRATKMSKAAMELNSKARVLLTGTPLQNHLSEIWNLFELANPGLLGGYQDFSERFIVPIEKHRDREKQRLLKRLISPFILRRTKAEVIEELPEKTEITLPVTLSEDERALYETLRAHAAEQLENGRINPIEALAELTKLRQAACHPVLIDPSIKLASSKTSAFVDLVDELIEGNHRALVFSQFTSHLALVRRELDARHIAYLYLDGSTPSGQRQKLVDAFQTGDMPLFLISLKAGGTGLNLTAADYVIHLDPWWNPAIEDQASDRSYRIGQDNPVTIYRLIAKDTIEEKILRLHATKKSLADALLEGSDVSSRLSREEILGLLSDR